MGFDVKKAVSDEVWIDFDFFERRSSEEPYKLTGKFKVMNDDDYKSWEKRHTDAPKLKDGETDSRTEREKMEEKYSFLLEVLTDWKGLDSDGSPIDFHNEKLRKSALMSVKGLMDIFLLAYKSDVNGMVIKNLQALSAQN